MFMDDHDPQSMQSGLLANPAPGDNAGAMSVSEVSARLKRHVEDAFGHVRIRGEISGWKRVASGHCYLALKDENARIDGVIWKGNALRLAFAPADGVEVIATGKLTTYPGRSTYQIVIDTMELAGEGAMLALLEKLKAKLAGEGLFDAAKKRPLPYLPRIIGVVTSPTGAVIRDILHRLADRFPTRVIVWPVIVQGTGAANAIAAAVTGFSAMQGADRPDLVIVARGGGSIEDLWAFNEEPFVRAVAGCTIPIISAVGHETDTTLCDFAADVRAPTPTAAAEMAVPVRSDLIAAVQSLALRSFRTVRRYHERAAERFATIGQRLPERTALLAPQIQRVDELSERTRRGLALALASARGDLAHASAALRPSLLEQKMRRGADMLAQLWRVAASLNPDLVLARGYARVEKRGASTGSGATLMSAAAAKAASLLSIRFADGSVDARVDRAAARPADKPEQGSLL
jgi:exodeoxyribonuclease VII large subunit